MPPAAEDDSAMDRRFEHYEVLVRGDNGRPWELGRGTMGVTYKARDTRLECVVALKVISAALLRKHPQAKPRFLREARAAAQLRHPNVASVFHLGERADGECFYAMEFIEGETLASRVARLGPLPVLLSLEIVTQVARALVAASQHGLVHRDLKPANLMLLAGTQMERHCVSPTPGGSSSTVYLGSNADARDDVLVKVIDFGLAKAVTDPGELTGHGNFLGTPHYASPEQFEGAGGDEPLDARSDIFSLGVTFWFLLTGSLPFPGRSLEEIRFQQERARLPLAQLEIARVPEPVVELLEAMLAVDPADRPQTPYALVEMLRRCRLELASNADDDGDASPVRGSWLLSPTPRRHRRRHSGFGGPMEVAGALLLLLAAGGGAGFYYWNAHVRRGDGTTGLERSPTVPEKSIAVLPFTNLSDDKENAFFADGIQDDVLTSLSKIGDLKVISRTSVLAYRGDTAHNVRQIARALGVAHVLEGTVRRAGSRVRVTVQLIDARDDRHVWAETYDRELTDALTLQSELAREIASALRATLSPEEKASLAARPTDNAEAYVLFLRGRDFQNRPDILLADWQTAERLFEGAVALDPKFALAYAQLSQIRSRIAFNYEPTAARRAAARAAAAEALRLQPNLGEAHLALAYCFYWGERDFDRALAELALAARALPGDADVPRVVANIRRRQGHWDEALAGYQRASMLDPRSLASAEALARFYLDKRDWPAAAAAYERGLQLSPDSWEKKLGRATVDYHWRGDLQPLRIALAAAPPHEDPEGLVTFLRSDVALLTGDLAAAERWLRESARTEYPLGSGAPFHRDFLLGLVHLQGSATAAAAGVQSTAAREAATAQNAFASVRDYYEAAVRAAPGDALRHADLGVLYAALGWRDAALGEGDYAEKLCPESHDAVTGSSVTLRLARMHALLGEADATLTLLAHLLAEPVNEWNGFSIHDLRLRPEWAAVRGDARFQRLLQAPPGSVAP